MSRSKLSLKFVRVAYGRLWTIVSSCASTILSSVAIKSPVVDGTCEFDALPGKRSNVPVEADIEPECDPDVPLVTWL